MILSALLATKYNLAYLRRYMYIESKQQQQDCILQVVVIGSNLDTIDLDVNARGVLTYLCLRPFTMTAMMKRTAVTSPPTWTWMVHLTIETKITTNDFLFNGPDIISLHTNLLITWPWINLLSSQKKQLIFSTLVQCRCLHLFKQTWYKFVFK